MTAGATPLAAATDPEWGGRSAFIADPESNRWEITWSPRASYDARGALLAVHIGRRLVRHWVNTDNAAALDTYWDRRTDMMLGRSHAACDRARHR